MPSALRDLRFAARLLLRNPGFAIMAVLCLGLGMGATTAVFTVVDAVLFRPLPYRDPERLVRLYTEFPTFPGGGLRRFPVSPPEFAELRETLRSFERLDAWQVGSVNLGTTGEPMRVTTTLLSGTLFESLGIRPQRGRWIGPADDREGAPLAILISDELWRRAYAGAEGIVGQEVKMNGMPATVAGVMPPGFQFPPGQVDVSEVWAPLQLTAADMKRRGNHRLAVVGQLRPGVTVEQARQEVVRQVDTWGQRASQKIHTLHPRTHTLLAYGMHDEVVRSVRPAMLVLFGAVGFVLLIACVNVANLLLARVEARQREISVRIAMGAGASGLVRQFLAEGLLISAAGSAIGLLIAVFGTRLLLAAGAETIPRAAEVGIDWRVLAFTGVVLAGTAVVFGLAPLAQALARGMHDTLKSSAGRTSATVQAAAVRRGLVVAELSLALVLLISCGLMLQALARLQAVNAGIETANRLTMRLALPQGQYNDDSAVRHFLTRLEEKLPQLPGVVSATVMTGLPPQRPGNFNDTQIENFVPREGGPVQNVDYWQFVGLRFFETLGARLVEGRFLDERDSAGAMPAVVVNEAMARAFWPGQSALGRRVQLPIPGQQEPPWRTIVGVVADIKNGGADKPAGTELFIPWRQASPIRFVQVVLKTSGRPGNAAVPARAAIAALDPALPVTGVRTMEEVVAQSNSRPRFLSLLLTFFTAIALSLAGLGVYGVISYSVARRTNEIGIRMAIGAGQGRILAMVLRQAALLGIVGVAAGVGAAVWLTRFLKSVLFAIEPLDVLTFAGAVVLLFSLTLLASLAPARRATRVDPWTALRYE